MRLLFIYRAAVFAALMTCWAGCPEDSDEDAGTLKPDAGDPSPESNAAKDQDALDQALGPDASSLERTCEPPQPVVLNACVTLMGDAGVDDPDASTNLEVRGTVEAILPSWWECEGLAPSHEPGVGLRIVDVDGNTELIVGLALPWRAPSIEVGDRLHVRYSATRSDWLAAHGFLELRDEADELIAWVAQTPRNLSEVPVPTELRLEDGGEQCRYSEDYCGVLVLHKARASMGDEEVEVPYGESAALRELIVVNGMSRDFEDSGDCSEGGGERVWSFGLFRPPSD